MIEPTRGEEANRGKGRKDQPNIRHGKTSIDRRKKTEEGWEER